MKEVINETPSCVLPKTLKPLDRQVLEMLVVDGDQRDAQEFLIEHGIGVTEGDDPLKICKTWFRKIRRGEQGYLIKGQRRI